MDRTFTIIGALMGFAGVGLGAFGAHALRDQLAPELLGVFETGVRYQMYHALAILATAAIFSRGRRRAMTIAGWSFTVGIVLFSGSLYAMALTSITNFGAVTPFGGLAFLVGWASLVVAAR